ncbi:MAG: M81 family metallopeptidase [Isosphaeraceae bacterium]
MRIAIGGIMHESNSFASTITDRARFAEGSLTQGDDLLDVWREAHHEMGGFIEGASRFGFDLVPTVMAWATPAGPVADDVLDEVVDDLIDGIKRSNADGLLLALHGAMVTQKHPDADAEVLRRLRQALKPGLPIITTLDYHANVWRAMANLSNALIGYQTYPHVDQRECGLKAAEMIARSLRGEIRPVTAIAQPPLVINLLGQETDREPMRSLMARAREAGKRSGMLSVSVMAGFPYADVFNMGPAVIAVADGDQILAEEAADELAKRLWDVREQLVVRCPRSAEAVGRAMNSSKKPVVLVDLGDNIGGGSAGDGTVLLQEILKQQAQGSVVVLHDPEAVEAARRVGLGGAFHQGVGGKHDRLHGEPVEVWGTVRSLHDGKWVENEPRHGGRRFNDQGATAVIDLDGANVLVLNSLRTPPFSLGQLESLGIDPARRAILVAKAAVAYRAAYRPIAGEIIEVDTPGLTAIDPTRFTYSHRPRPMYPFEK